MVHVLVVEDDIRLNQIVCASLRSAGYDARGCINAVEAFDLLHADGADIIISDIMMPGIDGFEFVADVRSVNKHIPILLMTALDESDGAPMFELCAYDIDWAAANQKDILARWQALMEGEAP